MLAVVYNYASVMEKWRNLEFVSEKEFVEAKNKLKQSLSIIKQRKKDNDRKLKEKWDLKNELSREINKFDDSLIEDHKNDL